MRATLSDYRGRVRISAFTPAFFSMIGELIKIKPEELPRRRPKPKPFYRRTWFQISLFALALAAIGGYVGLQIFLQPYRERAAAFDLTLLGKLEESSSVFDRTGKEIGRLGPENRQVIKFDEFPLHLIDALVATEDAEFWTHGGVSYKGILRAGFWNTIQGEQRQGASTITQQLARQTFGLKENSLDRKLVEACLAQRIEKAYTKKEILELYLNRIYLGAGFYGIEAAAQGYFTKAVKDLTLEEAAVIVGLIKNPTNYNPISGNRNYTLRERNEVYDRMVVTGKLSKKQAAGLKGKPLAVNPWEELQGGGYFQQEVEAEVNRILTSRGYTEGVGGKGFKVYTTLDSGLQRRAEESLRKRLAEVERRPEYPKQRQTPEDYRKEVEAARAAVRAGDTSAKRPETAYLQGAVLVIDNRTGDVLCMVGGRDYADNKFNRVTKMRRSPGTAFVPFVYAAAFEDKYYPGSRVEDSPMDNTRVMVGATNGILGEWGTERLDAVHEKAPISARQALMEGKNNSAARLGLDVGLEKVKNLAARAGLEVPADAAMLLGKHEVTIRDMALAYTIFPNGGGKPKGLSMVTRIEDFHGNVIYRRSEEPPPLQEVTDPYTAWMVNDCLADALAVGTGSPASEEFGLKDFPAAAKTGTHYNSTDLWCAGYDSEVTCVVWAGLDRPQPVYENAFGNRVALPVWVDIMNASQESFPAREMEPPEGIQQIDLCEKSGLRATDACVEQRPDPHDPSRLKWFRTSYKEYLRPGYRVDGHCALHSGEHLPVVPDAALPLPVLGGGGTGIPVEIEEARPVLLAAPTVVGEDPYGSIGGGKVSAPEETATAPKVKVPEKEGKTPAAPSPSLKSDGPLLGPPPPNVTVPD